MSPRAFILTLVVTLVMALPAEARRGKGGAKSKPRGDPAPAAVPETSRKNGGGDAATARNTVAVLRLGALGISSDMMKNLEMLLRNSVATIANVDVISPVDIQIALQDPKNATVATCGGGPRCAVKIGRLVGADTVVFGSIGGIGAAFDLNLRAVSVKTGKEIARQKASMSGNRDLLIPEMRLAAYRLIAPDRIRGSLLIEIDVEGVEIEIDGEVVGVTPIPEPVDNLTPGAHLVVIKRPGYSQFQQEFEIRAFETARLKLDLKKAQPDDPR